MNLKKKGLLKEQFVVRYLVKKGWTILSQNKKILGVELDIIAQKEKDKAVIEVKSIKSSECIEWVLKDWQKQRLKKAARSLSENILLYLATVDDGGQIDFFPIS